MEGSSGQVHDLTVIKVPSHLPRQAYTWSGNETDQTEEKYI